MQHQHRRKRGQPIREPQVVVLSGQDVVGTMWVMPTEVYSRIVGYLRPVQNWNKGKVQEFKDRKTYEVTNV